VVLVPNYNKDAMFLILYGFHDPSLNKSVMLFLISSSIVNSRVEYGHFMQELHPNLLIHLFAKNDLYLSINMAQLLTFNPIMCSNFSVALFCHRISNGLFF
jgi:hypothetical protein